MDSPLPAAADPFSYVIRSSLTSETKTPIFYPKPVRMVKSRERWVVVQLEVSQLSKDERFLAPLEMTAIGGLSSRTKREILAKLNHYLQSPATRACAVHFDLAALCVVMTKHF
jgi:hypothetical protein